VKTKKWIGLCSSELIFDCGWEYSFFLDVLASKRSGVSCSDSSVGSYFKGLVLVEFVLVSFSSSRLVGFQVLISKQQEVSGSVRTSSDPLSIPCVVTYTLNICVVKPQLCWPVCCSACVTCMWVYQYVIRFGFNISFGNQVLCCAWLSTAVYLICACLPASIHCAVMMSAIGVLRVAWNVISLFLFLLRVLLCVHFLCIMLAAPPKP